MQRVHTATEAAATPPTYTFDIDGAAQALALSRTVVYELIAAGQLRSYTVGRRRFISAQAVQEFIQARETDSI